MVAANVQLDRASHKPTADIKDEHVDIDSENSEVSSVRRDKVSACRLKLNSSFILFYCLTTVLGLGLVSINGFIKLQSLEEEQLFLVKRVDELEKGSGPVGQQNPQEVILASILMIGFLDQTFCDSVKQ